MTLGLRLSELSSSRNPDYYGYHGLAADAALRLADHTRALHHVHAGLACGRLPPLQRLSFVVMEGTALFRLERRQEAAERLMTLDAHPVIQAFVAESQLDDFTNAIHGLYGDELSSADLNELVASFSDRVLQIANLWLLLKETVEDRCCVRCFGVTPPGATTSRASLVSTSSTTAAAPYTDSPTPTPGQRPPHRRLARIRRLGRRTRPCPTRWSLLLTRRRCSTWARPSPTRQRCSTRTAPTWRRSPLADALEVLDKDHANTRHASLADRRASLLIELLRGRLDELTFGDLYLLLDTRLGEGLAERRLRELFPTAPAEDSQRSNPRAKESGHHTFGGRLSAEARGFIAAAMVRRGLSGDFRDMTAVRAWARGIAAELAALPPPPARAPVPGMRHARRTLAALCAFTGITALAGGLDLTAWPQGAAWGPFTDTAILASTPFDEFRVPGLLLTLLVGGPNLVAAPLCARRSPRGAQAAFVGGVASRPGSRSRSPCCAYCTSSRGFTSRSAQRPWHWRSGRTSLAVGRCSPAAAPVATPAPTGEASRSRRRNGSCIDRHLDDPPAGILSAPDTGSERHTHTRCIAAESVDRM